VLKTNADCGLGANQVNSGDYNLQLFDEVMVERYGLGNLIIGDLEAITDADPSFGRIYRSGAISVGLIVHTNL
jgi:hypothetical protein